MSWIRRLLGRLFLQGTSGQEGSSDIVHTLPPARAGVFPDYRRKHLGWDPIDKFDPFNLVLSTRLPVPFQKERDQVLRGEILEAKKTIRDKKILMNQSERLRYILEITNPVHELRHFHDFFGTRVGFGRFLREIEDTIEFSQLLFTLRDEGKAKLPLVRWHDTGHAPDALRKYLWKRREYTDWLRLYDGTYQAPAHVPGLADHDVIFGYVVGQSRLLAPTVEIELTWPDEKKEKRLFILGAQALMEGAAVILQRRLIALLFGTDEEALFKRAISRGDPHNLDFVQYCLATCYLGERVGKHHPSYQLLLSDLAMMGGKDQDPFGQHPGVCFLEALKQAEDLGTDWQTCPTSCTGFVNTVCKGCGWDSIDTKATKVVDKIEKEERSSQQSTQGKKSWADLILDAVSATHKRFMEIRKERPCFLADADEYLALMPQLPKPLAEWDGKELQVFGRTSEEAHAVQLWYFWDHLKTNLLFSQKMPCPNPKGTYDCVGSLIKPKKNKKSESCPFWQFLDELGLFAVKFEPA